MLLNWGMRKLGLAEAHHGKFTHKQKEWSPDMLHRIMSTEGSQAPKAARFHFYAVAKIGKHRQQVASWLSLGLQVEGSWKKG